MKKFLINLLYVLIPVTVLNVVCWGGLVCLSKHDDLTHVNFASTFDKEKRLKSLAGQRRLVIIGGSNARFGFHSGILRDSLHIEPVNMGIHIGLGLNYMFEQVWDELKASDILLISAEYQHFMSEDSYRGDEGLTDMYLMKQEWGKAFTHIINTNSFFSMYSLTRKRIKRMNQDTHNFPLALETRDKYNQYGDYIGHYHLPAKPWNNKLLPFRIDERVIADLQAKLHQLEAEGVTVCLVPPPYNQSSYHADSVSISRLEYRLQEAGIPFSVSPEDCVYPDTLFYDSQYHLTREGGIMHSEKIANLLLRRVAF